MACFIAILLALLLAAPPPLAAQPRAGTVDAAPGGTFITPFPENETYRIQVYGEGVAEGLVFGLSEVMTKDPKVVLQRKSRTVAGMLRGEIGEEVRAIEAEIDRDPPHVAVLMPNMIYRFPWREGFDRRFPAGSEARNEEIQRRRETWKAERAQRIDQLLRVFRRKNVAVYLVGQPIMKNAFTTDDAQVVNELLRERALTNGAKYIDIYAGFADADGAYDPQGPDIEGKTRVLRDNDGVSFNTAGFRKLGHFVDRELKRDIGQARAERSVPLAGGEDEQRRIRPARPAAQAASGKGGGVPVAKDGKAGPAPVAKGPQVGGQWATRTEASGEDVRADNSRITLKTVNLQGREDSLTIEIVRPPIPGSLLAAVTRRESADKPSQVGDSLVTELAGGQTVISSVTPASETAAGDRRRGASDGNLPHVLVLERGQRLAPKPGRADDMPWPRQEVLPAAAADAVQPQLPEVRRPGAAPKGGSTPKGPAPRG